MNKYCPSCGSKLFPIDEPYITKHGKCSYCVTYGTDRPEYPFPCVRCGYCCIAETCKVGKSVYGDVYPCPGLSFDGVVASCELAGSAVPVGHGCCVRARAIAGGKQYDFASLPPVLKIKIAQQVKAGKIQTAVGRKYSTG